MGVTVGDMKFTLSSTSPFLTTRWPSTTKKNSSTPVFVCVKSRRATTSQQTQTQDPGASFVLCCMFWFWFRFGRPLVTWVLALGAHCGRGLSIVPVARRELGLGLGLAVLHGGRRVLLRFRASASAVC